MNIDRELGLKLKNPIRRQEPLKFHTSWRVGGPADYFLVPVDTAELAAIAAFAGRYSLPLWVIGNGTNLLVRDGGLRGMVVAIGSHFSAVRIAGERAEAGAGISMTALARSAAASGLAGLEFAVGIPGSLGGAVIMNAGAYGGHIGELVSAVHLIDSEGKNRVIPRSELHFAYRQSNLPGRGIIYAVDLELKRGERIALERRMEQFLNERRRRHPAEPSAGSVFRNLPGQPAGRLIEEAGGKGLRRGGAEVSRRHANFIVNTGDASAADILGLMEDVRRLVKEECGLDLQPEVKIIGEEA